MIPIQEQAVDQLLALAHKAAWAARDQVRAGERIEPAYNLSTVIDILAELTVRLGRKGSP